LNFKWTITQKQRLKELNASYELQNKTFATPSQRDRDFHTTVQKLASYNKKNLKKITSTSNRPLVCNLESSIIETLLKNGFTQVFTPVIISRSSIEKMSTHSNHKFYQSVFWINKNKCLRPMLAPNLYQILYSFSRLMDRPVRIFEVGPCFRRDSGGKYHLNEFTMLNLVEMGSEPKSGEERLSELAAIIMQVCGINNYALHKSKCEVYGDTIDVMVKAIEVGSGVIGPHPMDSKWKINEPWVGIGFGLERLALAKGGYGNIQKVGRSVAYFDGIRLNI